MKRCTLQLLPDIFVVYITLIGAVTTKKREKKSFDESLGGSTRTVSKFGGAAAPTAPPPRRFLRPGTDDSRQSSVE